jgi:hypothetical protein
MERRRNFAVRLFCMLVLSELICLVLHILHQQIVQWSRHWRCISRPRERSGSWDGWLLLLLQWWLFSLAALVEMRSCEELQVSFFLRPYRHRVERVERGQQRDECDAVLGGRQKIVL